MKFSAASSRPSVSTASPLAPLLGLRNSEISSSAASWKITPEASVNSRTPLVLDPLRTLGELEAFGDQLDLTDAGQRVSGDGRRHRLEQLAE
jgi:hypothetical protein